MPFVVFEE